MAAGDEEFQFSDIWNVPISLGASALGGIGNFFSTDPGLDHDDFDIDNMVAELGNGISVVNTDTQPVSSSIESELSAMSDFGDSIEPYFTPAGTTVRSGDATITLEDFRFTPPGTIVRSGDATITLEDSPLVSDTDTETSPIAIGRSRGVISGAPSGLGITVQPEIEAFVGSITTGPEMTVGEFGEARDAIGSGGADSDEAFLAERTELYRSLGASDDAALTMARGDWIRDSEATTESELTGKWSWNPNDWGSTQWQAILTIGGFFYQAWSEKRNLEYQEELRQLQREEYFEDLERRLDLYAQYDENGGGGSGSGNAVGRGVAGNAFAV